MSVTHNNKVSIRLMSDGHAFFSATANAAKTDSSVDVAEVMKRGVEAEVVLCTRKTILVPAEQLNALTLEEHLTLAALAPAPVERVVVSAEVSGIIAVMAVAASHIEKLEATGADLRYTSPLLMGDMSQACVVALYGNLMYVRVADSALRFADVVEVATDADILYYLGAIDKVYHIYNIVARFEGDTARLRTLCKSLFRKILCE